MKTEQMLLVFLSITISIAHGDSLIPDSYSTILEEGESVTITKELIVSEGQEIWDIFFLIDSTGSMASEIATVQVAAPVIVSSISGYGNIHYGVGEYQDFD